MHKLINRFISSHNPLRNIYHKINAILAAIIFGFPANKMTIIGITGTNGKTTTANIITQILEANLERVGMISTALIQIGDNKWLNESKMTSPSPWKIQKLLSQMYDEDCHYAVLEVTSHAIDQYRFWGVNFDIALLTNITTDHIEYHGSMKEYERAKKKFFIQTGQGQRKQSHNKTIILNADDPLYPHWQKIYADNKLSYSILSKDATVTATGIVYNKKKTEFILNLPVQKIKIDLNLLGQHNVYNALAAITSAITLKIPHHIIQDTIKNLNQIPGRMEFIPTKTQLQIIIDYAHTADALEKSLKTLKDLGYDNIFTVFGATGGGRDKAKRPHMARVVEQYAQNIILTDDDPYDEDNIVIINQLKKGLSSAMLKSDHLHIIPDRVEAIRFALATAPVNAVIFIAGKGCETIQMTAQGKIPHSDAQVVRDILAQLEKSD